MPLFDDLIEELVKENLLDETDILSGETQNGRDFAKFSNALDISVISRPDFLTRSEIYELRLPEFSFLEPEDILELDDHLDKESRAIFPEPNTFVEDSQILVKQENLRRLMQKPKTKKKGKFCPNCQYAIHPLTIHCRFCRERVIGDLPYYSLMVFAIVALIFVVLLVLSDKTIN